MKIETKKKLVNLICKTSLQPILNKMHLFALTGMNYGNANTFDHKTTGEQWVIEYIKKNAAHNKELVVFDVGANVGNYSILLSRLLEKKKFKILAFEPSVHTYNLLAKNTTSLKNFEYFNFGFGAKEESLTIYSNYEGSGATTLYNTALNNYAFNKNLSEQVNLKTLDEFCKEHLIENIDFLKIDVEGHELPVLSGAMQMIKNNKIKFIQFEFGSFHVYSKTFFKDFWDLLSPQYKIYRIIRDGLFEIKAYTENLEIFRTSNFFAELKS